MTFFFSSLKTNFGRVNPFPFLSFPSVVSVAHFICVFLTFGNKYWGYDFLKSLKWEKKDNFNKLC